MKDKKVCKGCEYYMSETRGNESEGNTLLGAN